VAVDGNGVLYVADTCGEIYSIYQQGVSYGSGNGTSSGNPDINAGELGDGTPFDGGPIGIAVNAAGTTIYASVPGANAVEVFDSNFNYLSTIGDADGAASTATGKFSEPEGITLDNGGNLLVVDGGNSRVQKFSPSGAYQASFGNTAASPLTGLLIEPLFLAVDSTNNVYVSDHALETIYKYSSN
jgi:sugar lactone lactonase YvrE